MTATARQKILAHAFDGAKLRETFFTDEADNIVTIALNMAATLAAGNKILLCGNGGSAADCQHLAAEFVNRFMMERPPLPALALTTDTSILTAIGNDYHFDDVFSKQVAAFGNANDVLIAISTSGNSTNVIQALHKARERSLKTIGFTGNGGGAMVPLCDFILRVPSPRTPLIQEIHIAAGHLLCELTDYFLFENVLALTAHSQPAKEGHNSI